jgi:hypothetical protein
LDVLGLGEKEDEHHKYARTHPTLLNFRE